MKNETNIREVAKEAAKILNDYPHLKCYQAIQKAKEVLKNEGNIREFNGSDNARTSNMDA